jgi:hypothetical protein
MSEHTGPLPAWVTPQARTYWVDRLGLPDNDPQDWELTCVDRRWLGVMLSIYEQEPLAPERQHALACLIITSLNNRLWDGPAPEESERVRRLLLRDLPLHRKYVEYWACLDVEPAEWDDPDRQFNVTSLMRQVLGVTGPTT